MRRKGTLCRDPVRVYDKQSGDSLIMFIIVTTILSIVLTAALVFLATLVFFIAPRFTRRSLKFELDESVPVINEQVRIADLTVMYNGDLMANPRVIQFRLENTGKRDVARTTFDHETPMSFDFGVKIAAILATSYRPPGMIAPDIALGETVISIGPSLISAGAILEIVLLVDGPCDGVVPTYSLEEVHVEKRMPYKEGGGLKIRSILTYALIAFVIWWVIQQPESAAHLVHNVGSALSSAAHGLSNFVASILWGLAETSKG